MSNYITYEDRMEIENLLHNGKSFGAIAKSLKKDRSTISREIKKYSITEKSGYGVNGYNACIHKPNCTKMHVCSNKCIKQSIKYCKACNQCNDNCPDFEEQVCAMRFKPHMCVTVAKRKANVLLKKLCIQR